MRRDIEMPEDDEKSVMIENIESVPNLIGIGKQLLDDKDFSSAVEHFAMMCDELVPVHGDLGDILGEVYLYYGQSLLGLARNEIDVVGTLGKQFDDDDDNDSSSDDNGVDSTTNNEESKNATNDSKANSTGDKKEEPDVTKEALKAEEAKKENSTEKVENKDEVVKSSDKTEDEKCTTSKVKEGEKSSEGNKTDENKIDSTVDDTKQIENAHKPAEDIESTNEVSNGTSESESSSKQKTENQDKVTEVATNGTSSGPSTSTGIETEEKDEENLEDPDKEGDISNLQLAWEILELAKKIFAERNETGSALLIETLYHLGDVSFESENFDVAINDFIECIELQEKHNVKDRRLADAYFKTGLAYLNCEKYNESLKFFGNAKNVLVTYSETFKPASDAEVDGENYKNEYYELQDIIKEINNKIQDVEECLNETRKSVQEMLKEAPMPPSIKTNTESEASTSSETSKAKSNVTSSVPSVQANNITHLLRRKRPSDDSANEAVPSKKQTVTSNTKSPESK